MSNNQSNHKRGKVNNQRTEADKTSGVHDAHKATSKQIRVDTLNDLIEKTNSGQMATEREIRAAVTEEEWAQYQGTKHLPKPPKMPPFMRQQFTKYNELLRSADRRVDRAENSTDAARAKARNSGNYLRYKSPYRIAEAEYDRALEILEELLKCEPSARNFLDRPVSFNYEQAPSPDQNSVPRLQTSKSDYRLYEGERRQTNKELRLSTLLDSRDKLMGRRDKLMDVDYYDGLDFLT